MSSALRQCRNWLQLSQRELPTDWAWRQRPTERGNPAADLRRPTLSLAHACLVIVQTTARSCRCESLRRWFGVHVATLRAAARDGRLPVVYDIRLRVYLSSSKSSRREQRMLKNCLA